MDLRIFDVMVEGSHGASSFLKTIRVCAAEASEAQDLAFSEALKAGLLPSRAEDIAEVGPAEPGQAAGIVRGFGTSFFQKGGL